MSEIIENIKDSALRESLYYNYENVTDMVKFAETKNAAIIATSGAILSLTFDKLDFTGALSFFFSSGYFFLVLALFISFWALYPIYPIYNYTGKGKLIEDAVTEGMALNLIVFSNIAQFKNPKILEESLSKKYYSDRALTALEKDLISSIYVTSHIALRKFKYFKYSLTSFMIGCLLIVIFGPLK